MILARALRLVAAIATVGVAAGCSAVSAIGDAATTLEVCTLRAPAPGLTARLVREEDAEIVASRTFAATATTLSTEAPTLVAGFDRAAQQIMGEVAGWTLESLYVDVGS